MKKKILFLAVAITIISNVFAAEEGFSILQGDKGELMGPPPGVSFQGQQVNEEDALSKINGTVEKNSGETVIKGETVVSSDSDKSVIVAKEGAKITITDFTANKTGDGTSEDLSNFYGVNGAIVASAAGEISLKNSSIFTNAEGANAVFATGENSIIKVENVKISTTSNSSRGLDATRGGTVIGTNVEIATLGAHCGALATDRGSGTVSLDGGVLNTSGEGSPAIYSTGKISVKNITANVVNSELAVIEGKNTIVIDNSTLNGGKNKGFMIYQSFSGDAEVGLGQLTISNSKINYSGEVLFYSTNTQGIINLKNVSFVNKNNIFYKGSADRWGNKDKNGSIVAINLTEQKASGKILCDSISSATLNLYEKSQFEGSINEDKTAKSININIDSTSTWTVTKDSYVDSIKDSDSSFSNIKSNGHTIYYSASNAVNKYLDGKTIKLSDGGYLKAY